MRLSASGKLFGSCLLGALVALSLSACETVRTSVAEVAPPPPPPPPAPPADVTVLPDWRSVITNADRERYARRAEAWEVSLEQALFMDGSGNLEALGDLIRPEAALNDPSIPNGLYRCRTVKLGSQSNDGLGFVVYGWFNCRIQQTAQGQTLVKLTGSQRQHGTFYPESQTHSVLLGSMALSNETSAPAYGQRHDRDVVAVLERIGEQRWRLVTPWPRAESNLDILELVPASR
ncbi:DUF4893 domain-containing protein [uncultured Brevundimonas sp.]|uniref:DUF4893 domain-containing protein n=1 Tax=uncultured Brevundimonas sp. TaxID=213418 RepID=UPI0026043261|nr:DUF4893 domain-containing protein [uncultured Brevundimonas sp.]